MILALYRSYKHRTMLDAIKLKHQAAYYQHELEIEILKEAEIEKELDSKKRELVAKATYLQQKNDLIFQIQNDLDYDISLMDNDQDRRRFQALLSKVKALENSEEQWREFESSFIDVYPQFLKEISQGYPQLTSQDLKLCAYLKMNLNSKDIAHLTGTSVRTVETRRYRLRKKLNIPKDVNVLSFLNSFNDSEF